MARVLFLIALVLLTIYAIVELAQSRPYEVRLMPKWAWFVIICVPGIGPISWLLWGRPTGGYRPPRQQRPPDDDPDFLRRLG